MEREERERETEREREREREREGRPTKALGRRTTLVHTGTVATTPAIIEKTLIDV